MKLKILLGLMIFSLLATACTIDCGSIPEDQRGACCAEKNKDAARIECIGEWKYVDGSCTFECSQDEISLLRETIVERISQSYSYQNHNASNLREIGHEILRCPGCYIFTYRFNVETDELPENVYAFEVSVSLAWNEIVNISFTELLVEEPEKSAFEKCVESGYEVLEPDCEACPRQCITPNDIIFFEHDPERYCISDDDCACGVHIETRKCFFGNLRFVDESEQCPDFCAGKSGRFVVSCLDKICTQVNVGD
ncbi:MAG: hypothetical protein ACLFPQ_06450 [Candidatus Woesearchaeota archaeon]